MAIAANPPPQSKLPAKLFEDEDLRVYFGTLQEDMYRLWLRSGGGTDQVSGIVIDIEAINARLDAIEDELDVVEERLNLIEARLDYLEGSLVVTAIDVTTSGNTTIVCTAELTVTLAANPLDKDLVSIKAFNGDKIIIEGNGNTMDGETQLIIRRNKKAKTKTGLTMRYSSSLSSWSLL